MARSKWVQKCALGFRNNSEEEGRRAVLPPTSSCWLDDIIFCSAEKKRQPRNLRKLFTVKASTSCSCSFLQSEKTFAGLSAKHVATC